MHELKVFEYVPSICSKLPPHRRNEFQRSSAVASGRDLDFSHKVDKPGLEDSVASKGIVRRPRLRSQETKLQSIRLKVGDNRAEKQHNNSISK